MLCAARFLAQQTARLQDWDALAPDGYGTWYGNTPALAAVVDRCAAATNARLLRTCFGDPTGADRRPVARLVTHCRALKLYLLLGQGDFVQCLMDALAATLDKPAQGLYRHNCVGVLDGAVRASNARWNAEDVLKRLGVFINEGKKERAAQQGAGGCLGWDVFHLRYTLAPVSFWWHCHADVRDSSSFLLLLLLPLLLPAASPHSLS